MEKDKKLINEELRKDLRLAKHQANGYSVIEYTYVFNNLTEKENYFKKGIDVVDWNSVSKHENIILDILKKHDSKLRLYRTINHRGVGLILRGKYNNDAYDWNVLQEVEENIINIQEKTEDAEELLYDIVREAYKKAVFCRANIGVYPDGSTTYAPTSNTYWTGDVVKSFDETNFDVGGVNNISSDKIEYLTLYHNSTDNDLKIIKYEEKKFTLDEIKKYVKENNIEDEQFQLIDDFLYDGDECDIVDEKEWIDNIIDDSINDYCSDYERPDYEEIFKDMDEDEINEYIENMKKYLKKLEDDVEEYRGF